MGRSFVVVLLSAGWCSTQLTTATVLFDGSIAPSSVNDIGFSDTGQSQRLAEDFRFASPVLVNKISFLGGYYPSGTAVADAFTLIIYNNDPLHDTPNPSSVVAQIALGDLGRTDTHVSYFCELYSYSTTFPAISLADGTTYWLSVVNETGNTDDDWVWAGQNSPEVRGLSGDAGASWFRVTGACSFSLEGSVVPEPSVGILAALGLFVLLTPRSIRASRG